jgi:predicted HTH transcriptional regulator
MESHGISLSEIDLLARLRNFEDNFVERKTCGDHGDWLKTVVGFANTNPVGYPSVLFIGVKDDGTPEGGLNLDKLQQTFAKKMNDAYPPIFFVTKILESDGKQFLAIIVPGSGSRPHFAGPSYIRRGSRTEVASESQFDELLAIRNAKSGEILKWNGKMISIDWMRTEAVELMGPVGRTGEQVISSCNAFYVTLTSQIGWPGSLSIPLKRVEVSFDHQKSS